MEYEDNYEKEHYTFYYLVNRIILLWNIIQF